MATLHLVCGLPATGKTFFARQLASETGAAYFDSDTATDLMIQAAHRAAGFDPHDRDSPHYKATYRQPVYATLFALAADNLPHTDVIIAGPFTSELQDIPAWQKSLEAQFSGNKVRIHHLTIPEELRLQRMRQRAAPRDRAKLSQNP